MDAFAAVDLGASSGRVMLGRVEDGTVRLDEIARFENRPVRLNGSLHWNILDLYQGVLDGVRALVQQLDGETLTSIGIDTWAVDYALLGADGAIVGIPFHYRDSRTDGDHADLFSVNGIAQLPFNTVYQLLAETADRLGGAERMLMIPDLLAYWLTGVAVGEGDERVDDRSSRSTDTGMGPGVGWQVGSEGGSVARTHVAGRDDRRPHCRGRRHGRDRDDSGSRRDARHGVGNRGGTCRIVEFRLYRLRHMVSRRRGDHGPGSVGRCERRRIHQRSRRRRHGPVVAQRHGHVARAGIAAAVGT